MTQLEILDKLESKNIFFYIILFLSIISPMILIFFIYRREFFLQTDIIKLIFLSLSITLPIYLLNTYYFSYIIKYNEYEKRIDDDILNLKINCQNQISKISSLSINSEILLKDKERLIESINKYQESFLDEMEETKKLVFSTNLSAGGLVNIVVFYNSILLSYNKSFDSLINNILQLEFLFLILFPVVYISINKIKNIFLVSLLNIISIILYYWVIGPYISEFIISNFM